MRFNVLLLVLIMLLRILAYNNAAVAPSHTHSHPGIATFYTNYSSSACQHGKGGNVMLPVNGMFAAVNRAVFKRGAACRKKYKIRCTGKGCISNSLHGGAKGKIVPTNSSGGPITVSVVDVCWACKPSTQFALSLSAFAQLADPDVGSIHIRYQRL